MIWTLAGLKGGVGKTTLAANLAAVAQQRGARCLLVDATDRRDLSAWASDGGFSGPVTRARGEGAALQLGALALGFDHCIVDTQTGDTQTATALAEVSDRVLIPCGASPLDVWPLLDALEVFRASTALGAGRTQVLINGHDPRTTLGRRVSADLHAYGVDLVERSLARRAVHAEAMAHGESTLTYDSKCDGARELELLFDALMQPIYAVESEARVLH